MIKFYIFYKPFRISFYYSKLEIQYDNSNHFIHHITNRCQYIWSHESNNDLENPKNNDKTTHQTVDE